MYEMSVMFPSQGNLLAGRLLRPDDSWTRRPTLIVTGSWLTVKEQMPLTYAQRLVDHGYAAFIFDFAGFGASGGTPRQLEMPTQKAQDIASAARFLETLSIVQANAVGLLSVCASAQYSLLAIANGAPIRSFVGVGGWFHDTESVAAFYGGAEGVKRRLAAASRALDQYASTGDVAMVPAYRAGDETAAMFFELDYYGNRARGAVPAWRNEMATMSWAHWLLFDGLQAAPKAAAPMLLVHSDDCVFPDHAKRVHELSPARKRLHWSHGSQTDFYDQPAQVDEAVAETVKHFAETLTRP
jgi:dienelactone hydrolase